MIAMVWNVDRNAMDLGCDNLHAQCVVAHGKGSLHATLLA
jgi:hypothetical protein